ncbi:MAG: hypothetical protein COT74_01890 [Bdellovibrionales bacterium CG10_big_fil_rev_8_21_14_0_10_45_34]|nr:MAG: hypothetical protein COT74_01890 [Bdellovibrionales bacterium CG10_big_fil_rev_8_21_14_0_10_45_34]
MQFKLTSVPFHIFVSVLLLQLLQIQAAFGAARKCEVKVENCWPRQDIAINTFFTDTSPFASESQSKCAARIPEWKKVCEVEGSVAVKYSPESLCKVALVECPTSPSSTVVFDSSNNADVDSSVCMTKARARANSCQTSRNVKAEFIQDGVVKASKTVNTLCKIQGSACSGNGAYHNKTVFEIGTSADSLSACQQRTRDVYASCGAGALPLTAYYSSNGTNSPAYQFPLSPNIAGLNVQSSDRHANRTYIEIYGSNLNATTVTAAATCTGAAVTTKVSYKSNNQVNVYIPVRNYDETCSLQVFANGVPSNTKPILVKAAPIINSNGLVFWGHNLSEGKSYVEAYGQFLSDGNSTVYAMCNNIYVAAEVSYQSSAQVNFKITSIPSNSRTCKIQITSPSRGTSNQVSVTIPGT